MGLSMIQTPTLRSGLGSRGFWSSLAPSLFSSILISHLLSKLRFFCQATRQSKAVRGCLYKFYYAFCYVLSFSFFLINFQGSQIQAMRNRLEEIEMASLKLGPSILSIKQLTKKNKKLLFTFYNHKFFPCFLSNRNPE